MGYTKKKAPVKNQAKTKKSTVKKGKSLSVKKNEVKTPTPKINQAEQNRIIANIVHNAQKGDPNVYKPIGVIPNNPIPKEAIEALYKHESKTANNHPSLVNRKTRTISITVRNVTNHTLKDVSIFNNRFKEQNDVHYSTDHDFMDYLELMTRRNSIVGDRNKIDKVHVISSDSNQPFVTLWALITDIDGFCLRQPIHMNIDPTQNQPSVCMRKLGLSFNNSTDILISVLHPDTRVIYTFWIEEN